jgi:hypothetical protein
MSDYTFVGEDEGMTPAEYGYTWIKDCCLMHQWCSGARPVDQEVVDYCQSLVDDVRKALSGDGSDYGWGEDDLANIETLLRYLTANLGQTAKQTDGSFQDSNLVTITYTQVRESHPEPYAMKLWGDEAAVVAQAIIVGIDSHLEACFVKERGDKSVRAFPQFFHVATLNDQQVMIPEQASPNLVELEFTAESLPVLVRRLYELDFGADTNLQDVARCLADQILESIGLAEIV